MSVPTCTIEVSFTTAPMVSPVWVDITSYVRSWSTSRGRQSALDRTEAGTGTILLDNRDRRFDPTYTAGPYYGYIWPMRKVRIQAAYGGITYDVFNGFIESWLPAWPHYGKDETIEVSIVDGFKWLSLCKVNTSYSEERSDERIHNILDYANWTAGDSWVLGSTTNSQLGSTTILGPVGDRAIDEGKTTIQASELSNVAALQHLQDVVESENGNMFVDAQGTFVFHNRWRTFSSPYNVSVATFGDDAGELPYTNLVGAFDESLIYNDVRITRLDGTEQAVTNAASITAYGRRTLGRTSQLMTTDSEALSSANYLLTRYKDLVDPATDLPMIRFQLMMLNGHSDDDLWAQILGRELGDRITVKRRPAVGLVISQECTIIGISHNDVTPESWVNTEFNLMPADTAHYWRLGHATLSVLGVTTRLAY